MLIPFMGPGFPPIFSILTTIFWLWILFIIFLQPIGGIVYFFVRGPWPRVKKYLQSWGPSPTYQTPPFYQAPPASKPRQETYNAYEQGYQAQQAPATQENEQPYYTPSSLQPQYELPEIPYPEPPQMHQ